MPLMRVLDEGKTGEVYNIGGECEKRNLDIAQTIVRLVGASEDLVEFVSDRPGHDWRYAMDISKVRAELGWEPSVGFEDGLQRTIDWYRDNESWWTPLKTRA